jgi:signal transduction histidine kinase
MYVASGKSAYYKEFEREIKAVAAIMDTIEQQDINESALSKDSFGQLLLQKKLRTAQFIQLRRLSDSLLNFSYHIDHFVTHKNPKSHLFTARQFKSIVHIDTIKPKTAPEVKKKLLGRIFAAISNKKGKEVDTAQSTTVKTIISADTSSVNVAYNKLQLKTINEYYRKLYKINTRLKDKEIALLDANHLLINSIVEGLKRYKVKEHTYYSSIQQVANASFVETIKKVDTFSLIVLIVLISLIVFIFYAIYKLYQNEKKLIDYSHKVSLNAISKGKFLANMSHEIRTPLNSIIGFSEQLNQLELAGKQKEQLGAIRNSSIILLDVVNDILDFSKYEIGKVSLEKRPFSPYLAIKDVFDSLKIQTGVKEIVLELKWTTDQTAFVLGDPLRLKQIVINLLGNAIKFTNGGKVTLIGSFKKETGKQLRLKVSVIDTGLGISKENQKVIFDEFAQVYYASTKQSYQGTGLGLAICKRIVELHGGSIEVNSEENKGSTFSFEIPYEQIDQPEVKNGSTNQVIDNQRLAGKRILLAEDNALNILLAKTILEKYDVIFDSANDGKEALELFNHKTYDLILTDVQMPEMGGVELAKEIRAHSSEEKRAIPVLGITANIMQEDRITYLKSGMNELVIKPFLEQELLDKILKFI